MYDFLDKSGLETALEAVRGKLESYVYYAECATARSAAAKVVTCDGFTLKPGAVIAVRFTDTGTANPASGNITLNINSTGAKNIVPKGNNSVYSYGLGWAFCNNQTWLFMYNGTYFVHINQDNNTTYNDATTSARGLLSVADKKALDVLKTPYATCATARNTAAKVATLANFTLSIGATIAVKFTATDTTSPSSGNLTLNVNNTGAKTIGYFRNGSKAALTYSQAAYFYNNSTHVFTYDGTYWLCMDWNADSNTDTKVTAVGNHYTPAKSTTKSASGGTLTDITNSSSGTQVVTGVEMDAKGHVTGVTSVALKSTDTKVTVDSALSSTSTNPVQNKVVNAAIDACTELANSMFNGVFVEMPTEQTIISSDINSTQHIIEMPIKMVCGNGDMVNFGNETISYIEYGLANVSKGGLMSAEHFNFLEKYKKIRNSSANYTFTSLQDYITLGNCYGNCNNGLVVLSGWFTSTGNGNNPTIISGSFPSAGSSFVCGIVVNMDSPNTNTRLLVRHESDGTSSLQCGGALTAGKYFFFGVYTAERCAYNLPYTL